MCVVPSFISRTHSPIRSHIHHVVRWHIHVPFTPLLHSHYTRVTLPSCATLLHVFLSGSTTTVDAFFGVHSHRPHRGWHSNGW